MGHYSSAPRGNYVVLHHTGGANNHTIESNNFCNFSDGHYDFAVTRNGRIFVCASSSGNQYWNDATGAHARGCNCAAIGIVMHGCFGGCSSGNVSGPSEAQECAVAFLFSHIEIPDTVSAIRPHANCSVWDECGGASGGTVCPGTRFTSGTGWNDNGRALRDRLRSRRRNWDRNDCCFAAGDPRCPA
jgi:hypothetical protein